MRDRAAQQMATILERSKLLDSREPSDRRFFGSLSEAVGHRTPEGWLAHFRTRHAPLFFPSFDDRQATVAALLALEPEIRERVITAAEAIEHGQFNLLGYRDLRLGMPPDWHLDVLKGARAPMRHWSRIDYLDPVIVGDHKLVWELNRQHWLVTLGTAYWLTGDERYANTLVTAVSSWMNENPPAIGVNWGSSLEVAFRAIAWIWAVHFLRDSAALTPAFFTRLTKQLVLHARHIERNLSTWFSPNTHLTGEALGLFYVGLLFPELPESERFRTTGARVLAERLEEHALPDGVYFEQATYYHRYTVDFYLHFLTLAERNGHDVRAAIAPRLGALLEHLAILSRPDGTIPLLGDDDGGRLLFLDNRTHTDVRSPLATGAIALRRSDLATVAGPPSGEAIWLAGPGAAEALRSLGGAAPATSRAFPHGGLYVMRDGWDVASRHLVIDCGPHGAANCGHAHADALGVEIWADGGPVFVDPGTFTYTVSSETRDYFRSTGAHNTVEVDGETSSVMAGPFHWNQTARSEALQWRTFAGADWFEGRHDGYGRLRDPVTHRRGVLFVRGGYWVIRDALDAGGTHDLALTFQADRSLAAHVREEGIVDLTRDGTFTARLVIAVPQGSGRLVVDDGWVSPAYGVRYPAPRLRFHLRSSGPATIVSLILPRSARHASVPTVQAVASEKQGSIVEVRDETFVDLVLLDAAESTAAGVATDATVAWLRRRTSDGAVVSAMFAGGSYLRVAGDVELEGRGAASAWHDQREWRLEGEAAALNTPGRDARSMRPAR